MLMHKQPVWEAATEGAPAAVVADAPAVVADDADTPTALGAAFAADAPVAESDAPAAEAEAPEAEVADTPFELPVPEGMESYKEAYTGYTGAVTDFLKANPAASAKDALLWAANYQAEQTKVAGKAMMDAFNGQITTWETEARADTEIGGAKYDASVGLAVAGLKAYGSPKLVEALNTSGLGSHPEMIKAWAKIGKAVGESPVLSGEGAKGETSFAASLYGKKG